MDRLSEARAPQQVIKFTMIREKIQANKQKNYQHAQTKPTGHNFEKQIKRIQQSNTSRQLTIPTAEYK